MTTEANFTAHALLDAGISVIPVGENKVPSISWKPYINRLPTHGQVDEWFARPNRGIGRVCGAVSGNLETIDFDAPERVDADIRDVFNAWLRTITEHDPNLPDRLTLIETPRGGYHVSYRCEEPVDGNQKLASVPNKDGRFKAIVETRGEGGYALCPGSPASCHPTGNTYKHVDGPSLKDTATIVVEQRALLLQAARQFDQQPVREEYRPAPRSPFAETRPGDDFAAQKSWADVLEPAGFEFVETQGETSYWKRPGTTNRWSLSTNHAGSDLAYAFSPNCGLPVDRGLNKFAAYTHLVHHGDFESAAAQLSRDGFGLDPSAKVDISKLVSPTQKESDPFPTDLLGVPGIIAELTQYTNDTSFIPQPVLALANAIAVMGTLVGRKVRDERDSRANIYVIGLADSGMGKEAARKAAKKVLHLAGAERMLGPEGFASASGVIAAVQREPNILFQVDELGRLLKTTGDNRGGSHLYQIPTVLMKLFTSSDSIYKADAYADTARNQTINSPNCNLYGTTVPKSFFDSLTEESLTDGFVSRLLVFEGDNTAGKQSIKPIGPPSESLVEAVREWAEFYPEGNLQDCFPEPITAPTDDAADQIFLQFEATRLQQADNVWRALWSRAEQKARKLALIHACSERPSEPHIDVMAAEWACEVVNYLTRRMLTYADEYVSENLHEATFKRLLKAVKDAPGGKINMKQLSSKCRWIKAKERRELLAEMAEDGLIEWSETTEPGAKKPTTWVRATEESHALAV